MKKGLGIAVVFLAALGAAGGTPQKEKMPAKDRLEFLNWTKKVKPYKIIGNVYYVGANELTTFLITTPKGHILIDPGMEEMAPLVEENIEALGFHVADVKILLNTQAHIDHAAAIGPLKRVSGAKLMVSRGDASVIATGGATDFLWSKVFRWEPAKVDRVLKDGDAVTLGGVTLTAHLTPGHTKGCTTFTMTAEEDGKRYNVVFLGSVKRIGAKLVGNRSYPAIAADFAKSFALLRTLPCDVFLASHSSFFGREEKTARLDKGEKPNPFLDGAGFREAIAREEKLFEAELKTAQTAEKPNAAHPQSR